jgi:hypothetical protein
MRTSVSCLISLLLLQAPLTGQQPARSTGLPGFTSAGEVDAFLSRIAATRERLSRERAEAIRRSRGEGPGTGPTACDRIAPASSVPPTVVTGTVMSDTAPVAGANVFVIECNAQVATGPDGRYRLVLERLRRSPAQPLQVRARALGHRPASHARSLSAGDSTRVDFQLIQDVNALDEIVVSSAVVMLPGRAQGNSITNVQQAGVDEGGIVKLHGNHLVILRRGRLFTVAVGDRDLRPVSSVNAYGPGIDPGGAWYDEMLVSANRVVVIGYSYRRSGTELGVFEISEAGRLRHLDTWLLSSNDYYSSRNYSSRLIGSRLVFYSPSYLPSRRGRIDDLFPVLRRWNHDGAGMGHRQARYDRVYRPAGWDPDDDVSLHTVTTCDLAQPELRCESTVVLGPSGRVFYVSADAVYVWLSSWRRYMQASRDPEKADRSTLVRMPLDGTTPGAIGVRGSPVDQFSFLESGDGHLNVLVSSGGRGEAMWGAERRAPSVELLRLPLAGLGDGRELAPRSLYTPLPAPASGVFHNRFVGDHVLYGGGSGWGPRRGEPAVLYAVPFRGGGVATVQLTHGIDRIEVMGAAAVVVGTSGADLDFTGVSLGAVPEVVQRYTLPKSAQGETRSHGFFYRPDDAETGVLGLPVRDGGRPGYSQLREGSASIVYLRNAGRRFQPLGALRASTDRLPDDGCRASCVDWYGNARPIFMRDRVFALLGYEIVEGSIAGDGIRETGRVSFAPRRTSATRK